MAVYVLHFDPPYRHARHYIGFTVEKTPDRRLWQHLNGRGSPLVKAAVAAGCEVRVAAFWRSGTRTFERWLKRRADVYKWCPCCGFLTRPRATMATWRRCQSRRLGP